MPSTLELSASFDHSESAGRMIASFNQMEAWSAIGVSIQVKELSTEGKLKYAAVVKCRWW